ncbi:MAG: hypothetical protein R3F34_17335 [Planctomycetota bacterium]
MKILALAVTAIVAAAALTLLLWFNHTTPTRGIGPGIAKSNELDSGHQGVLELADGSTGRRVQPRGSADVASHDDLPIEDASVPTGSSFSSRYPTIAERIELDDVPLSKLDIETMSADDIEELAGELFRYCRRYEREYMAATPDWRNQTVDSATANSIGDAALEVYFIDTSPYSPPTGGFSPSTRSYLQVEGQWPDELRELRELSIELSTHPKYEEKRISDAYRFIEKESGVAPRVTRWEQQKWGQVLVGYDASGREVTRLLARFVGMPL